MRLIINVKWLNIKASLWDFSKEWLLDCANHTHVKTRSRKEEFRKTVSSPEGRLQKGYEVDRDGHRVAGRRCQRSLKLEMLCTLRFEARRAEIKRLPPRRRVLEGKKITRRHRVRASAHSSVAIETATTV